jgi:hypothetical protein
MIPGLEIKRIENESADDGLANENSDSPFVEFDITSESVHFTVFLLIGPPDPSILPQRLPQSVFDRGQPIHVSSLDLLNDVGESILEILELMNPDEMAVFICQDQTVLAAACDVLS